MSITRRQFLAGSAAALATTALTGCNDRPAAQGISLTEKLQQYQAKGYEFVDGEGKKVDTTALLTDWQGKPTALALVYGNCAVYCDTTANQLGKAALANRDLRVLLISIDPWEDFANKTLAEHVSKQAGLRLNARNSQILYPVKSANPLVPIPATDDMRNLFMQFGETAGNVHRETGDDGKEHIIVSHDGRAHLFGPDGREFGNRIPSDVSESETIKRWTGWSVGR